MLIGKRLVLVGKVSICRVCCLIGCESIDRVCDN